MWKGLVRPRPMGCRSPSRPGRRWSTGAAAGCLHRTRLLHAPTEPREVSDTASSESSTSTAVVPAATSGAAVSSSTASVSAAPASRWTPRVIASAREGVSEEALGQLAEAAETRRIARRARYLEDLLVFEGGALGDHVALGTAMIMRDFVHFALSHPRWGYYPKLYRKYRALMTSGGFDPIPYAALRNQRDYEHYIAKRLESSPTFFSPAQLFQPAYGWVMAEYLVTLLRAKFHPGEPLVVYDIGAGTGALAATLLDYLAEHFPEVYAGCEYHVVEQAPELIPVLRHRLIHHYHHVAIHHLSILNWMALERRRCVVVAMELFSEMPHDCILWDGDWVCSEHWFGFQQHDNLSTAHERYYPLRDPLLLRYLRYVNWMQEDSFHNLRLLCTTGGRVTVDAPPFHSLEPNMGDPARVVLSKILWAHHPWHTAWLPTVQLLFLEVLAAFFPRHHLLATDWSSVRQGLPGVNGPLLQVKLRIAKDLFLRRPVDRFHTNAGMVSMCFPTDFDHLATVYRAVCGAEKEVVSLSHPEFWRTYGGDKTALFTSRSGFNPLVDDFESFHVFATHHPSEL